MKLNKREMALILAGLRLLQQQLTSGDGARSLPPGIEDILTDSDMENCPPERIDRLCEKINLDDEKAETGDMPFETPIRIEDERFLVAADNELIIEAWAHGPGELDAIVKAVNSHQPAVDALAKCYNALGDWVDIQSKGDERESDQEALREAAQVLRAAGRLE